MNETNKMDSTNAIGPASSKPDPYATETTRQRYQRLSSVYDLMEGIAERRYHPWREKLWSIVPGLHVLEVGVGTGKNIPYYPAGISIMAIDLTPGMLRHAQDRVGSLKLQSKVELRLGDVQQLDFPMAAFDSAIATFVFCSVPDPVLGLRELRRVVKPGGYIFLLEHMRSPNPVLGGSHGFSESRRCANDGREYQPQKGGQRPPRGTGN